MADIERKLGRSAAQQDEYRRAILAQDPGQAAAHFPETLQRLQDALAEYGKYLALLPVVASPWE